MTISTQRSWVTDPHHECHRMCERRHHGSHLSQAICKNKCNREYQSPEHHSQISEKLAASAKSLFDESEKLSLIAEEIHNQDLMYL